MAPLKLLATGVTGYMGGSFLNQLLISSNPSIQNLEFTVLVRRQEQANVFKAHDKRINALVFSSLDDTDFLRDIASQHDIIIHSADGFHPPSAKALIEGLGARKKATGKEVYYIQTSGTSNLASTPRTLAALPSIHTPNHVFSDLTSDLHAIMTALEANQAWGQRTSDLLVTATSKLHSVHSYIVISPTVYGPGTGLFNKRSIQGPTLVRAAIAAGKALYVGDGNAEWDHAHIEDVAAFYEVLVAKILAGDKIPEGEKGYYYATGGKHTWKAFSEAIGLAGFELGVLETPEAQSVGLEDFAKAWTGGKLQTAELSFTSRSVSVADLGRQLGWEPKKTEEDWWASMKEEFEAIWKETKGRM